MVETASTRAMPIDTSPVDGATAAAIEAAEADAWADLYAAAPPEWAEQVGLGSAPVAGSLVLRWRATGRRYFSRAIGLGVTAAATAEEIGAVLDYWREHRIGMFLLQSLPHCRPAGFEDRLRARGLEPFGAQDRIVRDGGPLAAPDPPDRGLVVEKVDERAAEEWSSFLQRVYRLETGPWLPRLIGRPGWHQYVARGGGKIVAARAMKIGSDGTAWLGMDGPVPGLGTDDYAPDAAICTRIVADGLSRGVRRFIADIEAPASDMSTPAYADFARLGFRRPYVRTHWTTV
jgi:hypothetical protein